MRISKLLTKTHKLKILESFADDVCIGNKNFEIRKNDRGYQKDMRIYIYIRNHFLSYRYLYYF